MQQAIEYKYIKLYILIIALCIIYVNAPLVCYSYIIELRAECMYSLSCVCQGHRLYTGGGGGGIHTWGFILAPN